MMKMWSGAWQWLQAKMFVGGLVFVGMWTASGASLAFAAGSVEFTPEERAWLATEPVVRYSVDPNLRPLEYVENGQPRGLMVEFLKTIEADTGLRFAFVPAASGADVVRLFNADWIDLLPGLTGQRRLSEPLGSSLRVSPHYSGATIVVGRDNQPVVLEAGNLEGLRVAVTAGGREGAWLSDRVPRAIVMERANPLSALEAVIDGQADVAMGPEVAFLPIMRRAYRGVLSVAGTVPDLPVVLSMRVQERARLLHSVLNKALLAQTALETDIIFNRWFDLADFGRPNARALLAYYWREGALVLLLLISLIAVAVLSFKARRAARSAAEEKTRFLAVMSHEIRTAMNAVVGPIDVLSHEPDSPDRARLLATARTGAHVLLDTVNNLLDLSKLRAGKISVAAASFDVATLVHETLDVFRVPANQKGVLLATDAPRPLIVQIDGGRYRQVLLNLLSNALKFTASGRIDVALRVTQGSRGATLTTTVSDTGVGIPAADIERVFQDYEQSGRAAQKQGTGLGLAICREIVHLMGGQIGLTSRPGQGTSASFSVPIRLAASEAPPLAEPAARVDLASPDAAAHGALDSAASAPRSTDDAATQATRDTPLTLATSDRHVEAALREVTSDPSPAIYLVASSTAPTAAADAPAARAPALVTVPPAMYAPLTASDLLIGGLRVPHILVIDDNPVNREVVAAQLGVLRWTFELCDGGDSGLAAWEIGEFDAVLLDCHMPDPDGYEVARRMRLDEGARGLERTPILALSAHSEPAHVQRCLKSGMDGVMLKPLDIELLRETLTMWLESVAEARDGAGDGDDAFDGHPARVHSPPLPTRDGAALVALFVQTCDEDMSGLRAAFGARDRKGVVAHSHRIKGAAFAMGFPDSADAALAVELMASDEKTPAVWTTVGRGIDALAAVLTVEVDRGPHRRDQR